MKKQNNTNSANQVLNQKILFFTAIAIFVVGIVSLVVYNAINNGTSICLAF